MSVLVIVDIQNDFLHHGSLEVPQGNSIIPIINALLPHFSNIVYTKDWHPADHKSFAINHPNKKVGDIIPLQGVDQYLWPAHCVQNTHGSELNSELIVRDESRIIYKGTEREIDSYSAFFDNLQAKATGLSEYIRSLHENKVYICGLAADYCVKFSVLDAIHEGFDTYVIADATKAVNVNPGDYDLSLESMRIAGATIITSKQIL